MDIILASGSPRRRELLELILKPTGKTFRVETSDCSEETAPGLTPQELVMELAMRKAEAVSALHPEAVVIGSDTIVCLDGRVMGKPKDHDEAFRMLRELSGRTHTVYTGVALAGNVSDVRFDSTEVVVHEMTDREIEQYIATGDPMDKAGAYGIQGPFCVHVDSIIGSYFTVMGLPVHLLYQMLLEHGVIE